MSLRAVKLILGHFLLKGFHNSGYLFSIEGSIRGLAEELGLDRNQVFRGLKKLKVRQQVRQHPPAVSTVFTIDTEDLFLQSETASETVRQKNAKKRLDKGKIPSTTSYTSTTNTRTTSKSTSSNTRTSSTSTSSRSTTSTSTQKKENSLKEKSDIQLAYEAYLEFAKQFSLPLPSLTLSRKNRLALRLSDLGGLQALENVLDFLRSNDFYNGKKNPSGWKVSLDWLLKPDRALELLEQYQHTKKTKQPLWRASKEEIEPIQSLVHSYAAARRAQDFPEMKRLQLEINQKRKDMGYASA